MLNPRRLLRRCQICALVLALACSIEGHVAGMRLIDSRHFFPQTRNRQFGHWFKEELHARVDLADDAVAVFAAS